MPSFFEKLNTLVQAHINDIVRPLSDEADEGMRRQVLSRRDIRLGLDGDLRTLKKRVDDALGHEAKLQARVDELHAEIAQWDAKADDYLRQNNEAQARYALTQLRRAQADLEIAEQALREHHIVTQELVTKVSQLEAILEDARQREEAETLTRTEERPTPPVERLTKSEDRLSAPTKPAETPTSKRVVVQVERDEESSNIPLNIKPSLAAPSAESASPTPITASENAPTEQKPRYGEAEVAKGEALARKIAQKLDETREKLSSLVSSYEQTVVEEKSDVLEEVKREVRAAEVDDDLAKRRARLAKPE
ncbi:MAG: PspA/IM30 family protein [Anaerolineae bacterium]|nr:PspA/IM30 family protein [Anaerolineae bacterium]MDW8172405.1 PspA/IM30 family protein [Anaerolineae bacterium]